MPAPSIVIVKEVENRIIAEITVLVGSIFTIADFA